MATVNLMPGTILFYSGSENRWLIYGLQSQFWRGVGYFCYWGPGSKIWRIKSRWSSKVEVRSTCRTTSVFQTN